MDVTETTTATTETSASGEETPSIADILNWDAETKGELPEQYRNLSVDQVREFHAAETARLAAEATARETASQERAAEEQRIRAEQQTSLDFYKDVRARLESSDPEVKAAAVAEQLANEAKYSAGAAVAGRQTEEAQAQGAIRSLFTAMHDELESAGLTGALPKPGSPEFKTFTNDLAAFDGKGGFAAYLIDYGARQADARHAAEAAAAAEVAGRAATGAALPDAGGGSSTGSSAPGRYNDPAWVRQQEETTRGWRLQPSGEVDAYGRALTNNDLISRSMATAR